MAGWSKDKRALFEEAFYVFLDNCYIDSKDDGFISLGKNLYGGQRRVISQILDALENDIHKILILKSRQLGITTLIRAFMTFYIGTFKGIKGALVFDSAPNREEARAELVKMIKDLPARLKFPKIKGTGEGNREGLTLITNSRILFKSAGVKKSKGSGTLGRSVGLSVAHLSEVCSYDNEEGLVAFEESLSDLNPDRLYIYESTARGFNRWWEMWEESKLDPRCKCIFIGFWAKESQRIKQDTPEFLIYGKPPLSQDEADKIRQVRERYGVEIGIEQWAWFRRKMDPTASSEGDADPTFVGSSIKLQEQCVVEEDSFQQSGSIFFPAEKLTEITREYVDPRYKTYMALTGVEFTDMRWIKAPNTRNLDLKVWEEPDPEGYYSIGIDPAYGENPNNDRHSIQVCRCYADGVDQVAEYASSIPSAQQFAWIVASLLGWYGGALATVRYALELNGPGTAVWLELKNLRHQIQTGFNGPAIQERGLQDIFKNVRTYIYNRPDSLGEGKNFHLKTATALKVTFMERLRDFTVAGKFRIRSQALLEEMKSISRVGDSIGAEGTKKDDRVLAAAFALHCWETGPMRQLQQQGRTRAAEESKRNLTITNQVFLYNQNQLDYFFAQKRKDRIQQRQVAVRQAWRYR